MNYEYDYDAVVVGAGPAGSICAKYLAENNIKVLVVDKKQEIGTPKRCGEMIAIDGLCDAGLEVNPIWAVNEVYGLELYPPDANKKINLKWNEPIGYILERKIFEKHLAYDAIRAGAKYMVKTRATEVTRDDNGKISGIRAEFMGDEIIIKAKLIIAADGVDSKIAKSAGIKTTNDLKDYEPGFQYEMAGLKNIDPNILQLYFGKETVPHGYIWIFPKGCGIANVGIGVDCMIAEKQGKRPKDYLDEFLKKNPGIFKDASPIEINTGGIPVSGGLDEFVFDNLIILGDAAQQVNPITGGGISTAMRSGRLAAEVAAKAIKEGDLSKERLKEYEDRWKKSYEHKMKMALRVRLFAQKLSDDELNKLAGLLNRDDVMRLLDGEYGFLVKRLILKAPQLLPIARKILV